MADRYGHPRQPIFGRRHASAAATVSYSSVMPPPPHPPPSTSTSHQHHLAQEPTKLSTSTTSSTSTLPGPAPNNAGIRRNLFQGQLTRRPTGTGPNDMGPGGGRFDGNCGGVVVVGGMEVDDDGSAASSDIVVRDRDGNVELDEPPALVVDDPDEIALDMRQENEKQRQKLADAVKHHQIGQNSVPAQPEVA
ncbi:hypothetical protein VP1G_05271 [Cytospora mali]|uniref:Uncharacterized protein n=1 Tax=Cytospora mali TaxID=578113 RepID=A0A194V1X2_CYTMA|nr:hypothetical protein VP1G_05271 [Valsa mali var. pyri (nom. inval.)]